MKPPSKAFIFLLLILVASCRSDTPDTGESLTEAEAALKAGLEHLDQNQFAEAEVEFNRLIALAPEEPLGYANLGIAYMRQGKLTEAEESLKKSLTIDEANVEIRLNLFDVYELQDNQEEALAQLEAVLEYDPENIFALYKMSVYHGLGENGSMTALKNYLHRIIEVAPTNIVPRIYLIEHLLENRENDQALEQFEEIRSKFERLPEESLEQFEQAYQHLLDSRSDQAYTAAVMFHNQLKLTNWYQADIRALMGSEDSRVGIPLISFSRKMVGFGGDEENLVYQNVRFTEVSENAVLEVATKPGRGAVENSFIKTGDYDNDGDQDVLFGWAASDHSGGLFLYSNDLGRFKNVFDQTGIDNLACQFAEFADYDNDGFLDLFLITNGNIKVFHNVDELKYQDETTASGLQHATDPAFLLLFDSDHDGDLDVFVGSTGPDQLFRNNGDGSFTDVSTAAGVDKLAGHTNRVVIGDYDDDGDVDFFAVNENGNRLYANNRQGRFEDITASSALELTDASTAVSSGDFNNDGHLDLFISDTSGNFKMYINSGKARFKEAPEKVDPENLKDLQAVTHEFFDYDNDGWLDLVLAGTPTKEGIPGLRLLRNNQENSFQDLTTSLPEDYRSVSDLSIADYNEDSDLDLFTSFDDGSIGLFRNDGGNMNYQLKIQLVGLREGSGKNNYYGVGSKVEIRVGSRYQMRTITSPSEYFGLGSHERADILRIRWTNGVPQNIFSPHSDRDLIEQQKLKGSCPFLYAWNGEKFEFVKDMMWRSALGMPLGIMTSDHTHAYAFSDASMEYLKISEESLKMKHGSYQLKITGELWETIYLDQLALYAVDHPDNTDFRLDEKFVAPPFPELQLYPFTTRHAPISVSDGISDLLNLVKHQDHHYISNFKRSKFQGITELKDLVIDLGEGISTDSLHLFLNGWIFPADASINMAVAQSPEINVTAPYLQVINKQGNWETVIETLGFPLGKNKTMVTDLSTVFKTNDRKIRIRTSMQIYWDHIFYAYCQPFNGKITPLANSSAVLQSGGFHREFRQGGRNGPHWFDYQQTDSEAQWMDLEGKYTRYGDIAPLLTDADNQYVIYNAGDEVSLSFSAGNLPELRKGWKRDFIIYSVGWVKDGDLNTAHGQTVTPLPFHGMSSYPYPDHEQYPYQKNSQYLNQYNTRDVNADAFRDRLKQPN